MPSYVVVTGASNISTWQSHQRGIARESGGRLWCVYQRRDVSSVYQVYLSYSDDNGQNWTEIQVTDHSTWGQNEPSIAMDSGDTLHIVWNGHGWGTNTGWENVQYAKRTSAGVWTPSTIPYADGGTEPEHVTDEAYNQSFAAIAVDSSDNPNVVWLGGPHGDYTDKDQIVYRKRTTSWQAIEVLTNVDENQSYASIAIGSNDNIHVTWVGAGWGAIPGYYQIQYRKRTDSWQTQESVSPIAAHQRMPCLALDSNDQPHVAWQRAGIRYRMRTDSWQTQEDVHAGGDQGNVSISLDANDDIYVAWKGKPWGSETGYHNIQVSKRTGGVPPWPVTPTGVTDRAYNQDYPRLAWALHPLANPTIPAVGCAIVFSGQDSGGYQVEFYASPDLDWEGEEPLGEKTAHMAAKMIAARAI